MPTAPNEGLIVDALRQLLKDHAEGVTVTELLDRLRADGVDEIASSALVAAMAGDQRIRVDADRHLTVVA